MVNTDIKGGGGSLSNSSLADKSGVSDKSSLADKGSLADKSGADQGGPAGKPPPCAAESSAGLNQEAQDAINRQLRKVYGDLLNSPMPDKFKALLANLAGEESKE